MAKDLICGMDVDVNSAKFISDFNNTKYYFCSSHCKMTFDKAPKNYVK